jgi:hypothetical protein
MVMEIKRIADAYQVAAYGQSALKAKKVEPPDSTKEAVKENVEISPSSINLQKVKETVQSLPDVRIPIVEKIKERIKNNDYPISLGVENAIEKMLKEGIV